jgi:hypothetical protein
MGLSYRIKTELGANKTINVQLDQEFEFLEILSLKIQQSELYTRSCADYGVIVGRVTANNGLGIPNARVGVFIPITSVDESNPLISSIYPYESPSDKNEDGYRYNLLPYEKSYSKHSATGTLPTRSDVLTGSTAVEIFDTYYRYTAKTNESGDYMIMGIPLGDQAIIMDVDLSDIGEFSLTPQDLIRMGLATESQVAGSKFRTSTDLNSLPQIVNLVKNVEISPLWGDTTLCQIAINRLDFDLRDDANIDIQPTSVFMGSMFSTADSFRLRANARPRDNMGNLCSLTTSPGQILAIRQTIQQDEDGNPILEEYELEQSGNVIDGSGTWLIELPMNLDYFITNEFGEKILSNDPSVGIPTKSKYRFKIKWSQPNDLTLQTRRPYYLVPNVKEYGWRNSPSSDPSPSVLFPLVNTNEKRQQQSSYYFGLAWSGYTNGFIGQSRIDRLNEVIDCEDTFYEFQYNRVYTVSSLIDQFKKGRGNGKFIGIKEIDDQDCEDSVNKFPVNDGFRNFDFLFFLFSIIFTVIQPVALTALTIAHILIFLYNLVIQVICFICGVRIPIINVYPFRWICNVLGIKCDKKDYTIKLPMITYPECQACECSQNLKTSRNAGQNQTGSGLLSYVSSPDSYYDLLASVKFSADIENGDDLSIMNSEAIAGLSLQQYVGDTNRYKIPLSQSLISRTVLSTSLPIGERINIFNSRNSYFNGENKIKLTFAKNSNIGKYHYDNTITVLCQEKFEAGDLLTFVNLSATTDTNYLYSASTPNGIITGISGETYNGGGSTYVDISYATTQTTNIVTPVRYVLPYGSEETNYKFPSDLEYYQVVTAITVSDAAKIWNKDTTQSFGNILYDNSQTLRYVYVDSNLFRSSKWEIETIENISPYEYFTDGGSQYILVLQRGVDPYSPKYTNEYSLGNLFGTNENDPNWTFTANTRINIPIQKVNQSSPTIQNYNQDEMYFQSYFFKPGTTTTPTAGQSFSGFNTTNTAYYGLLDSTTVTIPNKTTISSGKVITITSNGFYSEEESSSKYDLSEDISGVAFMGSNRFSTTKLVNPFFNELGYSYYTKTFFSTNPTMTISNDVKNILRTDRLPSSDGLDGSSFTNNPSLLQQNNNFSVYLINTDSEDITSDSFSTGAQTVTPDLEGLPNAITVIESFNCESMVGLDCYSGFGDNFTINQQCTTKDAVEGGCYMFLRRPLLDLFKDIDNFGEWGFRFRFFYGLCRGVLSQSFMNNWINGTLYMFPLQVNTYYDSKNKPEYPRFANEVAYFNRDSNNFYYRSSPWSDSLNKFIGKRTGNVGTLNDLNLLFPTTIINLGMKDYFYSEITFDSSTKGYIIPNIDSTSYGDTSDLVNLFVISRITNSSFLSNIITFGDNSLNQLFSRPERRIDGDLAQLMSINSEIGNVNFSPEYYEIRPEANNPTNILGTSKDPVMAVWFSSTTQDLQTKDYLTPGRINFRGSDNVGYYPYPYGIKSQLVPFYQWKLDSDSNTIFGNQLNDWATTPQDIIQNNYQDLDRSATNTKYYLNGTSLANNLTARGYIYSVDGDVVNYPTVGGRYTSTPQTSNRFLVGAPFQFYFGVVKGQSALDRFKTKYSLDEN